MHTAHYDPCAFFILRIPLCDFASLCFYPNIREYRTCVLNCRTLVTRCVSSASLVKKCCCVFRNLGISCTRPISSRSSKQSWKPLSKIITSFGFNHSPILCASFLNIWVSMLTSLFSESTK